jgi:hypothetical protein
MDPGSLLNLMVTGTVKSMPVKDVEETTGALIILDIRTQDLKSSLLSVLA